MLLVIIMVHTKGGKRNHKFNTITKQVEYTWLKNGQDSIFWALSVSKLIAW